MFLVESEKGIQAIRKQIDSIQSEIDKIQGKYLIKKRTTKKPFTKLIGLFKNGRKRR